MPNIADYETQDEWMAACVPTRVAEGDSQEQAVAVCLNMWREKSGEKQGPYACECLECGHTFESAEHCADVVCPECGGQCRRAERPGPGKALAGKREYKTFDGIAEVVDAEQGIVDAYVAVMGNQDDVKDIIHPGAFRKTLAERGNRVLCVDQHNHSSIFSVLGKPLEIREAGRNELPARLLERYPDTTGALFTKTQYLLGTPEGRGAFERIKVGAINEYSIGFDSIPGGTEFAKADDGDTVRHLKELRLWEYGPVLWGINPATMTVTAKADESKAVMKTEVDGEHPASHYLVVEDPEKVTTWHLRVRDVDGSLSHRLMGAAWAALHEGYRGNRYEGPDKREALRKLRRLYEQEGMETPKSLDLIFAHVKAESLDQRLQAIREAWIHQTQPPQPTSTRVDSWVSEIYDTYVIVSMGTELYRYPYTEAEDGQIVFGQPTQVEMQYVPVQKSAGVLLEERKEALVESLRVALANAEALRAQHLTAPPIGGRDRHAKRDGAEPPRALTPEQEAQRQSLLAEIQSFTSDPGG